MFNLYMKKITWRVFLDDKFGFLVGFWLKLGSTKLFFGLTIPALLRNLKMSLDGADPCISYIVLTVMRHIKEKQKKIQQILGIDSEKTQSTVGK